MFDVRNADKVPFLVRAYDMQWSMGIISYKFPWSPVTVPSSAYSVPSSLAFDIGGWDTDAGSIGEDMHMGLKAFFSSNGNVKMINVWSSASQCNIEGRDGTYWSGLVARYVQSKRHLWGALDLGYVLRRGIYGVFAPGYDAPLNKLEKVKMSTVKDRNIFSFLYRYLWILFAVLESHIYLTQIILFIATCSNIIPPGSIANWYWRLITVNPVDPELSYATSVGSIIRIFGTICFILGIIFYEYYQQWASVHRWNIPGKVMGTRPRLHSIRRWYHTLDWLSVPIYGIFYVIIPQLQVHFLQLFYRDLVYIVSAKPVMTQEDQGFVEEKEKGATSTETLVIQDVVVVVQ
jgi:Glycosyl transferase family group 2